MIRDAALLAGVVANALGSVEQANRLQRDTLRDFLRPRAALLLLDNCEHLLDGCAALATDLLSACSGLRLLTTSREALGVSGETIWRVPGLSVPPADARPDPTSLPRFEAVQLLQARARASRADFALTTGNAPAVMQICQRLDGLPLAIELAAARLATLSVNDVATRLDDCFGLLTGGNRTALPRQQTLRATMEWSYGLLSAEEQRLLRRLSIFAGGYAGEAAAAVCGEEGAPGGAVLDLLGGLVAKSLVGLEESNGAGRYRLLETVRQYGWERLEESGEAQETRHKHAAYYLALAEEAESALTGPDQGRWLQRLDREYDNLRALRRSRDSGEHEIGLRLAAALWRFWYVRGRQSEGRRWLENLLAVNGAGDSAHAITIARARALYGASVLAAEQGDYQRAAALSLESVTLFERFDDTLGRARALNLRATVTRYQGDQTGATALYEESLALFRALGHGRATTVALSNLGHVAHDQGDEDQAGALYRESLTLYRGVGEKLGVASCLEGVALVDRTHERFERAALLYGAATSLRTAIGAPLPSVDRTAHDHTVTALREALGEDAFAAAWAAGQALSLEQAIAAALTYAAPKRVTAS
jgi:predicted ATPase